jgi:hypothetical protein
VFLTGASASSPRLSKSWELQGGHINRVYYKAGAISQKYHKSKDTDGEPWLRVELEQADTHAGIKLVYRVL